MATKTPTSERRLAALEILNAAPSGHFAKDIAAAMDMDPKACARMLFGMKVAGQVRNVTEGTQRCSIRVRYFVPQHEATAMQAHEAGRGVTWGVGRATSQAQRLAGFDSQGEVLSKDLKARLRAGGDAIVTSKTKITVVPTKLDPRFVVDQPERFFSRPEYRPDFIGADRWSAKAFGGGAR